MILRNLIFAEIIIIFVLHSSSADFVCDFAPTVTRRGFYFCVFICNLIFVKENVKWVGVKLSGKFRIIKLLFCSTLSFILLSFLLFSNGQQRFIGKNFRRKNFSMEKYTGGKIFRCKDD
jgi:hypothetical protein